MLHYTRNNFKGWLRVDGFILNVNRVHNEDLIVSVLSRHELLTLYRFYGARHSQIQLGYKIDFETEANAGVTISRLRNVLHLGYSWLYDLKRLMIWQQFSQLMYKHLQTNDAELDSIYYNLLEDAAKIFEKQNPKRIAIESYVKLLRYEGRLHTEHFCFICEDVIINKISLARAFLPAHPQCINALEVDSQAIELLFRESNSMFLSDIEVEQIYAVLLEGL